MTNRVVRGEGGERLKMCTYSTSIPSHRAVTRFPLSLSRACAQRAILNQTVRPSVTVRLYLSRVSDVT